MEVPENMFLPVAKRDTILRYNKRIRSNLLLETDELIVPHFDAPISSPKIKKADRNTTGFSNLYTASKTLSCKRL